MSEVNVTFRKFPEFSGKIQADAIDDCTRLFQIQTEISGNFWNFRLVPLLSKIERPVAGFQPNLVG